MKLDYIDSSKSKTAESATASLNGARVSILSKGLVRVEYSAGAFLDLPTQRVFSREARFADFKFKIIDDDIVVFMGDKIVTVNSLDFSKSFVRFNGVKRKIALNNDANLKGATRTLDMSPEDMIHYDDGVTGERIDIYYKDERIYENGVVSENGVAVYDDVHSLVISSDGTVVENRLIHDYYVFLHRNDYQGALDDLYAITGKVPMLPRFVFGNWWSRYWQYSDFEYINLLDKFKEKNVPISVATIDMDWHYVDIQEEFGIKEKGLDDESFYGESHGWTGYSWNKRLFPDHVKFLEELRDRGLKVTMNLHPSGGIRWFEDFYVQACRLMGKNADDKRVIPFDFTDNRFIETYFAMLKVHENEGVDFWWIDWQQGSESKIKGLDPLWALNHYHYYKKEEENKRGLILSRYSGVGAHRYPLGFSGDTTQKWEILDFVIKFTVRSTNSGYTFWSHDIGGHHSGFKDDELYIRWLQFALFNPIFRLHSTSGALYGKEPWNFDREIELTAIDILRRRQKFIPYLYTVASDNHFLNKPFIEPVYYRYSQDERAHKRDDEYFLGDMLVCPITTKTVAKSGFSKRKVFLPSGIWTDIFTDTKYKGNCEQIVYRKLAQIPVFAKDGTIIYRDREMTKTGEKVKAFDLKVFVGNGQTKIYEDDGETLDYKNDDFLLTKISQERTPDGLTIKVGYEGNLKHAPAKRSYRFVLPNVKVFRAENDAGIKTRFFVEGVSSTITLESVTVGVDFSLFIGFFEVETKEYLLEQIKMVLLPYNGHNQYDHDFFDALCRSDVSGMERLINDGLFGKLMKNRMLEILKNAPI